MQPVPAFAPDRITNSPEPGRIRSIDVFRGLTMAVMIFVNDLAGVKGLPWWTYHIDPQKSGMTYVDVVFPAFLFILGISIPLAVQRRLDREKSMAGLWRHILTRSISLIVLGVVLANVHNVDSAATRLQPGTWGALALTGAILFSLAYPSEPDNRRKVFTSLRWAGFALLVAMLAIFRRRTDAGELAWLDFSYWEILGLIGRVYLAVCIVYIPFRKRAWAPVAFLAAFIAWNIGSRLGMPRVTAFLPYWVWPFDSGELPSIALAGIVCTSIFARTGSEFRCKAARALAYAAALFGCGLACASMGISKNAATPTWCLYSAAISVLLFLGIYYAVDVRGWRDWASFAKPAGSNTLLTYLLPDLFYFICGSAYAAVTWQTGGLGVLRSIVFTGSVLGISALLTKARIRIQL
jgi:heparan-alpha-glucosaminide N-acetyltransferase